MTNKIFLIRNVAPDAYGGGEIYQLKLAAKLKSAGIEPFILTNSKQLLKQSKEYDIKTLIPPYAKRQNWSGVWNAALPAYFMYQLKLKKWYKKIFQQYQPAVVNIQSRDDFMAATLAAKKLGIKILWTDHADFKSWILQNVNIKGKNLIGKKIIKLSKYADQVIFVSQNIKQETEKLIRPKKLQHAIVIENGVEDELPKFKNIEPIETSFVYIGRVVSEKGITELIEAFNVVSKKFKNAKLNIYGDGNIDKFKTLAANNKNIIFHGPTTTPLKVLAENKIFVLPSYCEGLSLSLLEAAMMKKKIIASNVDGNPEVIKDKKTGLLVSAKNTNKLAEAMLWMLEHEKQADKLAENARKLYEENFDLDKIFAEKMLPLYNIEKEKK